VSARLRVGAASALALLAAACATASAPQPSSSAQQPNVTALATTLTTAGATWALVPMGHLDDPLNTFWQAFALPNSRGKWTLVTPAGVADSGGLVAADAGSGGVVIGFRPSQALSFSPLAISTDGGTSYTPDLLTGALAELPDSLAVSPTGDAAAVVDAGSTVLRRLAGTGPWQQFATRTSIAASALGRACGVRSVTAVAETTAGTYLGLACSRSGTVGLVQDTAAGLQPAPIALPAALASAQVDVIRLTSAGGGVTALLRLDVGGATSYALAWTNPRHPTWTLTPAISGRGPLASTTIWAGGAALLTGDSATDRQLDLIGVNGLSWTSLPPPPAGTVAVAVTGPRVDALAAGETKFTAYTLNHITRLWSLTQVINVVLPYGSAT